jgi:hypothetical protein
LIHGNFDITEAQADLNYNSIPVLHRLDCRACSVKKLWVCERLLPLSGRCRRNPPMEIETIILFAALLLWTSGFLLLRRLRRCALASAPASAPGVSIIIPARNEEHNLPRLLRSLAAQPVTPKEIMVVDDGSTDRTAELARQLGATVIPSQPLPDGWRGKTWACHQGANDSTSDRLLFVDADTWFEPDGLARILSADILAACRT